MVEYKVGDVVVLRRLLNPQFPSDITTRMVGIVKEVKDNAEQEWHNTTSKVYVVESASGEWVATDQILTISEFNDLFTRNINALTIGMMKANEIYGTLTNINTSEAEEEKVG